jgi:hypothetical protein
MLFASAAHIFCLNQASTLWNLRGIAPSRAGRKPAAQCSLNLPPRRAPSSSIPSLARRQSLVRVGSANLEQVSVADSTSVPGSSRMKGGSMTKMILDAAFSAAFALMDHSSPVDDGWIEQRLARSFDEYQRVIDSVYSHSQHLGTALNVRDEISVVSIPLVSFVWLARPSDNDCASTATSITWAPPRLVCSASWMPAKWSIRMGASLTRSARLCVTAGVLPTTWMAISAPWTGSARSLWCFRVADKIADS